MNINHFFRSLLLFSLLCALSAFRSVAAPDDEHWSPQFGWPGTATLVHSILKVNDRLYVGGEGTSSNTVLNVWDGNQWSNLGVFNGNNTPTVYDLAWYGNSLYAGGFFTNVNGIVTRGLARWDGMAWNAVGVGGNVFALLVDGSDLYVAGSFTNVAGVAATNVARWNGSAWSQVGIGIGRTNSLVTALLKLGGTLYAAGTFTNVGSLTLSNIAQWNGTIWTNVGGGLGTTNAISDRVYGLGTYGGNLVAAGSFTNAGNVSANGIARWDGASWTTFGTGFSGVPFSVAEWNGSLHVGGFFTSAGGGGATNFAVWNGSTWSGAGNGLSGTAAIAYRVVANGTNVIAGGSFNTAGFGIANEIATWDGTSWGVIGAPNRIAGLQTTVRALASDGANLYAAGDFIFAGRTNATRVARFDGTNWSALGSGLNSNTISLAVVGTNLYAGGNFSTGGGKHLLQWTGSGWVSLNNVGFATVNALAPQGNDLLVAGYFSMPVTNGTANWLARWDGTNFWKVDAVDPNTFSAFSLDGVGYTAIAAQDSNVYMSGHFSITVCDDTLTDCTNSQFVTWFDGIYNRVMGTGLNTNATSIAIVGTNVYFAGPLTIAGGVPAKGIARWNGTEWSAVGGGIVGNGSILSLAAAGTNLYAAGTFTNLGGVPIGRIAKWDGTSWSALGSGPRFGTSSGTFRALTVSGSDLFAGGTFSSVGGKPSYHIARWNEGINFDPGWLRLGQPTVGVGGAQFSVTAVNVSNYVIEASSALNTWTAIATNSTTPLDYTDPAVLPARLYRARSLP